jgi:N-acylneuraminate cytidylyltransferase/CMP-N,N'-diacetyllegionaminic acid synthase
MTVRLCTVCARGGSKGVQGKNLKPLLGKPLILHTLEQARAASIFDAIGVSSDSAEILDVARRWGADHLVERPAELAGDTAPKVPAIRHAVLSIEETLGRSVDVVCDLDATAPLRAPEDVRAAIELLEVSGASNVIAAVPARRSPYFNMVEEDPDTGIVRLVKAPPFGVFRRQDAPACFDMNASIYVWRRESLDAGDTVLLAGTRIFKMASHTRHDIDEECDFAIVEAIMMRMGRHA